MQLVTPLGVSSAYLAEAGQLLAVLCFALHGFLMRDARTSSCCQASKYDAADPPCRTYLLQGPDRPIPGCPNAGRKEPIQPLYQLRFRV